MEYYCNVCKKTISVEVYEYSTSRYNRALCRDHQRNKKDEKTKMTPHARRLYNELQKQGIKCEPEEEDGHKSVDISIPWANLYIEVDGKHHVFSPKQLSADIQRSHWSKKDGIDTIHIPNQQIEEDVVKVARSIAEVARQRYREMNDY